ncbi:MAG: PqqD family protein [Bacteroidales bacterium]|nr:PqqD family protein [Bacteroidales bacterium]
MNLKNNIAISDSGFVFNPSSGESFSVNQIGLEMLNMLRQKFTTEDIVTHIEKGFQAERPTIERDLNDFIDMMNQYHLMQDEDE